jgi:Iap family predicted aminopeptidase
MAQAHVGHLADAAGHDHWAAGAAIGIAIAIGLAGKLRERAKARDDEAVDVEDESEEVPA